MKNSSIKAIGALCLIAAINCANAGQYLEEGIVLQREKIVHEHNIFKHEVKHYAKNGGVIGLTSGAIIGGISAGPIGIPVGSAIYGVLGAGFGAVTGLVTSTAHSLKPSVYTYKVRSLENSTIYSVEQSGKPIPVATKVRLIPNKHGFSIRNTWLNPQSYTKMV